MSEVRWIVTEYLGPGGLAALEGDWRSLYDQMPNPAVWHSHEAYSAYVEHLCPAPETFRCFALSDGERVRAILPIEERLDRGLFEAGIGLRMRVLGMPWKRESWALVDAIGPEDDARRALLPSVVEHLRGDPTRPAVLAVGRTRAATAFWDGLADIASWKRYAFADVNEFVLPTDVSAEAFTARLSRSWRQTLRRAERHFEALAGATFVRATTREDLAREYERFLEVEASGWKGAHGSAIRQSAGEEGFYRAILERLTLDGRCEIHSLYAEGRCLASGFWVFTRHECVLLKCGYDEAYAHASPGRLLTHKSFELACEDPSIDSVDLFGDAPWLRHWIPGINGSRRAYVSLRPVSGTLFLAALRIRYGPVRRIVRALREWRRKHDDTTRTRRGLESG